MYITRADYDTGNLEKVGRLTCSVCGKGPCKEESRVVLTVHAGEIEDSRPHGTVDICSTCLYKLGDIIALTISGVAGILDMLHTMSERDPTILEKLKAEVDSWTN